MRMARRIGWTLLTLLLLGLGYAAWDLFAPLQTSLRSFDPVEVAQLEARMWRSYYEQKPMPLYLQLARLLRTEYDLPYLRSHRVAFDAAKAAFVFKRGKRRSDYEQAIPPLVQYYAQIRGVSKERFDVAHAARLEVEWWIVHRERKRMPPTELPRALAALQAELYGLGEEEFLDHARLRAQAMTLRDDQAEAGGLTEADWLRIEDLLLESWKSLHRVVNSGGA